MTKIVTVAVLAGAALALSACGANKEEAPAEPVETEMMAPEGEAEAAAEGLDPTNNPIGPAPAEAAGAEAAPAAEDAAPAAE